MEHVPRISRIIPLSLKTVEPAVGVDLAGVLDSGRGHRNPKHFPCIAHGDLPFLSIA
jgi:hypothetical protein